MHEKDQLSKPSPQNVLVVDDEQQVCELLAETLSFMGHEVQTAKDGMDAVEKLEKARFSVVITDMDMPRMDGMALIKFIVENKHDIDIIAITGHTMNYKYTDVIAAGATDFIIKPFTLNELEAKLNRLIRERDLRRELQRLAVQDHLTGLFNRRIFQTIVHREAGRSLRYEYALFLIFLDIDHFKDYNDQKGHQAGDALLVGLSDVLRASIRKDVDTAYRFGGDEFTVVLPHLSREHAMKVAERIRENYNRLGLAPTFLSLGVARFLSKTGTIDGDVKNMIHRADAALYHAKHDLGGNKVHLDEESHI